MTQDEITEKLVEVEQRGKSNTRRLDSMERRQDNLELLTRSFSVMQAEQEHIKKDIEKIGKNVETLMEKPAEAWNTMQKTIFTTIVSAMGTAIAIGLFNLIGAGIG